MTPHEFEQAVRRLADAGTVTLPYGVFPFTPAWQRATKVTAALWNAVDWNAPSGWPHLTVADKKASAKPTLDTIEAEHDRVTYSVIALIRELRMECHRRITKAYGETSWESEVELRLRGAHTNAQDVERDRLRAKYQALIASVKGMTLAERKAFDASADANWTA